MNGCEVAFPNIGLMIDYLPDGFMVFGFKITFYGVIIACGIIAGYLVAAWQAQRTGQSKDFYLDFAMYAVVIAIIGARLYYVAFSWDEFKDDPLKILNLRTGGLAIYGGIIAAILTAIVYTKIKKVSFWLVTDTGCVGLLTGQIIGRWGNFFNKEAFGGYTDNLLAMRLPWEEAVSHMSAQAISDLSPYVVNGMIQVHPTFLYESVWNLAILICLLVYTRHKKFDGEIFMLYLAGYGLGRFWIEGLRTDQLLIWGTGLPVSQLLAAVLVIVSVLALVWKRVNMKKRKRLRD